jgi:hypothetical protein
MTRNTLADFLGSQQSLGRHASLEQTLRARLQAIGQKDALGPREARARPLKLACIEASELAFLDDTGVQPNHGWRHLWREIVRGTRMKPELCDYMCGHEGKSGTGARYGKWKVPVLAKEMALFPRFKVPALNRPPAPHSVSAAPARRWRPMTRRERPGERPARGPLRPDHDEDRAGCHLGPEDFRGIKAAPFSCRPCGPSYLPSRARCFNG